LDAGYKAQLDSVVMLKNEDNVITSTDNIDEYKDQVVYIPSTIRETHENSTGSEDPFKGPSMDIETAEKYFEEVVTDTEIKDEDKTYYPLSLQYRPYTADGENVRKESIAGNEEDDGSKQNRSYYGNTSNITNEYDLDAVLDAVELSEESGREIPVVVSMNA